MELKVGDKVRLVKKYHNGDLRNCSFRDGILVIGNVYKVYESCVNENGTLEYFISGGFGTFCYVSEDMVELVEDEKPMKAIDFLERAMKLQEERGKEYDAEQNQERSMGKTVVAFNAITGHNLSESEGWLLLQLLKDTRQWAKKSYHADSAEDCVAYAALKAEALAAGK